VEVNESGMILRPTKFPRLCRPFLQAISSSTYPVLMGDELSIGNPRYSRFVPFSLFSTPPDFAGKITDLDS